MSNAFKRDAISTFHLPHTSGLGAGPWQHRRCCQQQQHHHPNSLDQWYIMVLHTGPEQTPSEEKQHSWPYCSEIETTFLPRTYGSPNPFLRSSSPSFRLGAEVAERLLRSPCPRRIRHLSLTFIRAIIRPSLNVTAQEPALYLIDDHGHLTINHSCGRMSQ